MQYWKPEDPHEFAGDMMPFWDGERFHLFYLLDHDHHAEQGGLGGHQWAHASTSDLMAWEHHPLALPIGDSGSVDQHGICTGSIFEHEGVYHAFYATRIKNAHGSVSEAVCRASSRDLIHFDKSPANPLFFAPPDYDPGNHRDPFVFRHPEDGLFHMLVTASKDGRGVLAHYTSENLDDWRLLDPFLIGRDHHAPECPEIFYWNGWWYLIYGHAAQLEYRVSRTPIGPWKSAGRETIEAPTLAVPRTAAFTGDRRIAVGFLPWRQDDRDEGDYAYAGNAVFRELLPNADGRLGTRFVPEMMPQTGPAISPAGGSISLEAGKEMRIVRVMKMPSDGVLTLRLIPGAGMGEYGLLLRSDERLETGYRLHFLPQERRVTMQSWPIVNDEQRAALSDVDGLDGKVEMVICLKGSVLDISLNGVHTLVGRGFDHRGTHLGFFASDGTASLENLSFSPLL